MTDSSSHSSLIAKVFSPFVAVSASEDAEELCLKNGLTFSELIRPFAENVEVVLKDPTGTPLKPVKIKVNFRDLATPFPQAALAKKLLSDAVSGHQPDIDNGPRKTLITQGIYEVDVCSETPWYDAYRDAFFQGISALEHDFTRHFLGCVFVVSSANHAAQQQLGQLIHNVSQIQLNLSHHSKWFFNQVAHYYVLLHDGSTGDNKMAEATFLSMKNLYGSSNCHMLTINSVSPSNPSQEQDIWSPTMAKVPPENGIPTLKIETNGFKMMGDHPLDPLSPIEHIIEESVVPSPMKKRGIWLTSKDRENVKTFVADFASQCLVPFVDVQLKSLNEQVANKKGIHKTFANAAKSFFAGRGRANMIANNETGASTMSVTYSQQAPELIVRKLGDLAFLFRQYEKAYEAYHLAKRDFQGDQAWLYCAGAEEMAALSVIMIDKERPREYPSHYFDSAINSYMNVCKSPQLATRALLLHAECLKSLGDFKALASLFIRIISEESDLRSALFLEQTAYCHLKTNPVELRKYAFHMVLAGHRFSKAGMRKHSLRAYREAEQVFNGRGWGVAEDHILYIIGKQCSALGRHQEAFDAFHRLLDKKSQQNASQQILFVKEYLTAVRSLERTDFEMPIPKIDMGSIRTVLGHSHSSKYVSEDWLKLEECCYLKATGQKTVPYGYTPFVDSMDSSTLNDRPAMTVLNEPIVVEMKLTNPLQINLTLSQIHLCWELKIDSVAGSISNFDRTQTQHSQGNSDLYIETCSLEYVNMDAQQEIVIKLTLIPKCVGQLEIIGIAYQISLPSISPSPSMNSIASDLMSLSPLTPLSDFQEPSVWGFQSLQVRGPKEKNAKKVKNDQWYAKDYRLLPRLGPQMPCLKAEIDNFPKQLFSGEILRLNLNLKNTAACGLKNLLVGVRYARDLTFGTGDPSRTPPNNSIFKELKGGASVGLSEIEDIPCHYVTRIPGVSGIEAGETVSVPFWIRGSDDPTNNEIMLLFYYESAQQQLNPNNCIHHRVLKFSANIAIIPSLIVNASAEMSMKPEDIGSVLVSLQAKNASELDGDTSVDLSLLQVSLVSKMFSISKNLDVPARTPITTIRPREVRDLALKIRSHKEDFARDDKPPLNQISQWSLSMTRIESSSIPCADFMMASACKLGDLKDENSPLTTKEILDIEVAKLKGERNTKKRDPLDLTLSVIWKGALRRDGILHFVMGQHHVNLRELQVTHSWDSKVAVPRLHSLNGQLFGQNGQSNGREDVCVSLDHPNYVDHDFSSSPVLNVPVTLLLHNPSVDSEVKVKVSCMDSLLPNLTLAPPAPTFNPMQESLIDEMGGFLWTKKICLVKELQPAATERINLNAMFLTIGTFNMSYGLNITVDGVNPEKPITPFQRLLIVDHPK